MIRMGGEEFFIEPLDQRWGRGAEEERAEGQEEGQEEEEEAETGRKHVVYRASAIIKKAPAVNQSTDDFIRGKKSCTHWA